MSGSGDELDDLFSYYLCPVFDGHPGLSPDSSLAYPGEEDVRLSAEEIPEEAPGPDAFVAETGPVDATVGLLGVHGSVEACIGGGLVGPGPGASGHASGNALDLTNIKNSAPMKKQTLKELVDLVSSSDISSTDRNVLSALILRHPEVEAPPEVLPLYSTYNGETIFPVVFSNFVAFIICVDFAMLYAQTGCAHLLRRECGYTTEHLEQNSK